MFPKQKLFMKLFNFEPLGAKENIVATVLKGIPKSDVQ
jgi:hypothetical protein